MNKGEPESNQESDYRVSLHVPHFVVRYLLAPEFIMFMAVAFGFLLLFAFGAYDDHLLGTVPTFMFILFMPLALLSRWLRKGGKRARLELAWRLAAGIAAAAILIAFLVWVNSYLEQFE